jgi:uncharacterized protein (TIGR03086 family)
MSSPSDQLQFQTTTLRALVAGVKPDQWDNATPCDKWTVRDVVNHIVGGGHMFATSFAGNTVEMPDGEMPDMVGDDPLAALDGALSAFEAAADTPGAMDNMVVLPFATLPAQVALDIAKFDLLVHCYDIASATRQPFDPPAAVTDEGYQIAQMIVSPDMRAAGTFGDEVAAPPNATSLQRMLAFSGRSV